MEATLSNLMPRMPDAHQLNVVDVHTQGDVLELEGAACLDGGILSCSQHISHLQAVWCEVVLVVRWRQTICKSGHGECTQLVRTKRRGHVVASVTELTNIQPPAIWCCIIKKTSSLMSISTVKGMRFPAGTVSQGLSWRHAFSCWHCFSGTVMAEAPNHLQL
eukprot:651483-Pelagomonas_calceolata.AAC.4